MTDTPDTPVQASDTGRLDSERTDAINKKRTGDQAFGGDDEIGAKIGRSATLQSTAQVGDRQEQVTEPLPSPVTEPQPPQVAAPVEGEDQSPPQVAAPVEGEDQSPPQVAAPVEGEDQSPPQVAAPVEGEGQSPVVVVLPVDLPEEICIETFFPNTISMSNEAANLATTVSVNVSVDFDADESSELTLIDSDEIDEGFRALADLIDTSSRKCSYNQGYVKRQLVYACRTCTLDVLEPAGFCLACALHCHEQHDVVPMLTRRNFRCDCGNSKFGPRKCQLSADKDPTNTENVYNEALERLGVSGTELDEDIVQCRVCEEQFHASHLGVTEEDFGDEFDGELICKNCLNKNQFLQFYLADFSHPEKFNSSPFGKICLLIDLRKKLGVPEKALKGFVFPAGWWEDLCKCGECSDMYQRTDTEFLLDPEDTFTAYEEREANKEMENVERASDMSPEDIFAQICDGFDSVTQVELAHWFNDLREIFVEFLQTRIQQGQTITDADIEEFFTTFNHPQNDDNNDDVHQDAS